MNSTTTHIDIEELEKQVLEAEQAKDLYIARLNIQRAITELYGRLNDNRGNISETEINGSVKLLQVLDQTALDRLPLVHQNAAKRFKFLSKFYESAKAILPRDMFDVLTIRSK